MELKYILFLLWKTSDFVVLINNLSLVSPPRIRKSTNKTTKRKSMKTRLSKYYLFQCGRLVILLCSSHEQHISGFFTEAKLKTTGVRYMLYAEEARNGRKRSKKSERKSPEKKVKCVR